jgi:hypothetical protein
VNPPADDLVRCCHLQSLIYVSPLERKLQGRERPLPKFCDLMVGSLEKLSQCPGGDFSGNLKGGEGCGSEFVPSYFCCMASGWGKSTPKGRSGLVDSLPFHNQLLILVFP